ncbi:hypothetical protein [Pseudomonas sp. MUP55]|uniref:hypothetical protein n=1 Tax=Pseudomonas sp. MUP55 TaxID=3087234 RepID=UPI002A5A0689|nr:MULTISPECIES: hypothetical protein [unclassified Pseudomonas]WPN94158.1 hypothetical protein SC319_07220 [Pseudomonas sp. MUP56]WPN99685.1 hypothetical protein SC318_07220 [Pseudomonas sp. MUP55]
MPNNSLSDEYLFKRKLPIPKMAAEPVVPPPFALPLLGDEQAYTIPLSAQVASLPVEVQTLWGGADGLDPGEVTTISFYWDDELTPFDIQSITAPYDERDLPVTGTVPQIKLNAPGLHLLRYTVMLVPGDTAGPSSPILINIDKQAPNQNNRGAPLIFPSDVETGGVTDAYLEVNGDQVVAEVPRWSDIRLEDEVVCDLVLLPLSRAKGKRRVLADAVARTTITQAHVDGAPIELVLTGDVLRSHGNAEYNARYFLSDRAGNEGPPSRTSVLLIDLTPTPTILRPIEVPQLAIDGLIDLEDARDPGPPGGVYMHILEVAGTAPGDILQPYWDFIPLGAITIGIGQIWPVLVPVDYATLASGGSEFTAGTIRADYTWQRGTGGPRRSPPRFVPVNLTVAGPVSPGNPDPVNRLLDRVTVKGLDGDNQLTVNDRNRPARVIVPLYAGPVAGQSLELMWGDPAVLADTYIVRPEDRAGDEIEFFVPWALIEPTPGVVPTFYWTFNGVNRQRSLHTDVTVNIVPIEGLLDPEFPDVSDGPGPGANFINCDLRPWVRGVRVRVPGDRSRLSENDTVIVSWASYGNTNGHSSGVIPETIQTFPHILTEEEAEHGFDFWVPFDPYIRLPGLVKPPEGQSNPRHGSAVVQYRLIKSGGGGMGESERRLVFISLIRPDSPPCLAD